MRAVAATRSHPVERDRLAPLIPPAAAVLAGGGPVVLLGFSQGGYPVQVVAGYGVALWWLLLVGLLTRAIPRPRPTAAGWVVLGSVTALAVWGAASLTWSADPERGLTEAVRLVVAGGSILLGMSAVRAGQARALAGGVLAGLSLVVAAGVLSRLQPGLLPQAVETAEFLQTTRTRLSWPLNYWNALAASAAVAISLAVPLAARAQGTWTSGLVVAPIPTLALGLAFTLSRGGIVILAFGLCASILLVRPRLVVLRTLIAPLVGSAIVLWAALRSSALTDVTGGVAQTEAGRRLLLIVAFATLGTVLVQIGWANADRAMWTVRLPRPGRKLSLGLVASVASLMLVAFVVSSAAERVGDAWSDFKVPTVSETVQNAGTAERFTSISGNGRYQVWAGAIRAWEDHPVQGIGLGSWESWWNPHRGDTGFIRNAHSQPLEVLAETGLIGLLLFGLLIGVPIAVATSQAFRRRSRGSDAAWAAPALLAFALAIAIDWSWQIGAFAVAGMVLAAPVLSRVGDDDPPSGPSAGHRRARAGLIAGAAGVVAMGSIAVLAMALVAPAAVSSSRSAAERGDLLSAAQHAARGASAAPFAASPALQQAMIEEQAGHLGAALQAATAAADRAPDDWRPWFLIARIQTARGESAAAVKAYRRARMLNPNSHLLPGR